MSNCRSFTVPEAESTFVASSPEKSDVVAVPVEEPVRSTVERFLAEDGDSWLDI